MFSNLFRKKSDRLADELIEELESPKSSSVVLDDEGKDSELWEERLQAGLERTRTSWVSRISSLFKSGVSEESLEEFEELLLEGDLGVAVTTEFIEKLREGAIAGPEEVERVLRDAILEEFQDSLAPLNLPVDSFAVILIAGINGVGKTTTTAKLAHLFGTLGKKCMLVAGDTFRAGATEQLGVWGERLGIPVVIGSEGQDPASVAFEGLKQAREKKIDLLLVDTAGRLHTKLNLMEEMKKISRVISKNCPGAPHETLLVVDATTGQNAIQQARVFHEAVGLTGMVMTKLDGTPKGGSLLAIHREMKIPVRFIGVGESLEDLRNFHPQEFTEALFAR